MELALKGLLLGAAGGLIGGMLGVGGGILMVPMLMALMGMGIKDAKSVSLAIIIFVSVAGTVEHQMVGRLAGRWPLIIGAGIAGATFSVLGARWSEVIPRDKLLKVFAVLLIVTGLKYLLPTSQPNPDRELPSATAAEQ